MMGAKMRIFAAGALTCAVAALLLLGSNADAFAQQANSSAALPQSDMTPYGVILTPADMTARAQAHVTSGAAPSSSAAPSSDADLSQQLSNPISSLISVPFQGNLMYGGGANHAGSQFLLNIQPVVPFSLNADWNVIVRTIVPVTESVHIFPGEVAGIGDTVQSFFFSPSKPTNGITWGVGPVLLLPTATRDEISANQFGAGPTFVALTQFNGYTAGVLANQIWGIGQPGTNGLGGGSILADDGSTIAVPPGRSPRVNATFVQPFLAYTFAKTQTTVNLTSESTYDWTAKTLTLPIVAGASQLLKVGNQPISVGLFGEYWAVRPEGAPAWAARFQVVFLFPK
jgi:hypothetical protein